MTKPWFLTREKIRELFTSPISDRIASVSFAPAIYAASMSYTFFDRERFLILSSFVLGLLLVFNIARLLSQKTTTQRVILLCTVVIVTLVTFLSSRSVIVDSLASVFFLSIILETIGIAILHFALLGKSYLSGNIPVLLTILFLNSLSIVYVADMIGYAAMMALIVMLSVQLCCGYDFFPHEKKPLIKVMAGILLLFFSVFVLTPFRFVLANPEDYRIPIKDFFPYLTIYTLLLTAFLFVIFYFLIRTKILVAYIGLFCIVIYFVYSSIPHDIGQIKDLMLENPENLNVSLPFRMVEILILSLVFYFGYSLVVKKNGIIRFSRLIIVITIVLPTIVSMQVGGFFINNYEKIANIEIQKRYIARDKLALSSNGKNIIVLLLDAFSSQILPDLFEKKPDLMQELDGFVWYKDTMTAGSWTWNGTPGIWGGHDYTADKVIDHNGLIQEEYFYGAYKIMPTEMLNRGFKVNYYNQYIYTNLIGTVLDENFKSLRIGSGSKDLGLLYRKTYLSFLPRVTLLIGSPFLMKSRIYNDGDWGNVALTQANSGGGSSLLEKRAEWEALNALREYSSEPIGDVFTFFMSPSTHGPYVLNWSGEFSTSTKLRAYWDYEGGLIASYYSLKSVVDLIDKLKSDGLYEKTKIILVSDHGNLGVPKTQTRDPGNIIPVLPKNHGKWFDALLMVKEFDSSGPLRTDTRFMSNADVLSLVMGTGDQIPAGRRLIHTAQFGGERGMVMIQMDTTLSTDGWKIIRNDITTDCEPALAGCAQ